MRIEVSFKPAPGTRIVPSTFRVLYGLMKIDLTDRLKKHTTVTETGVIVDQAQVPAGQHRLILQVDDDGPGIEASQRATVVARGARLDESVPGSGLGLAIVQELAGLYGDSLDLDASALGGLRVRLRLPGA